MSRFSFLDYIPPIVVGACLTLTVLAWVNILASCRIPTQPGDVSTEMWEEWRIAQNDLAQTKWGLGAKPFQVQPTEVEWVGVDGQVECAGVLLDGCYSTDRIITWNINVDGVIRFEAGHAVLHILGDARWACYGHTPECWRETP